MIDFDYVLDAINDVTQKSEKYVIGNHFTEQSSLSLADWATFLSFKEDKTLQSDIENYISNYKPELDIPSKQFISSQRSYIKPIMFQDISKRYLELIDYKDDKIFVGNSYSTSTYGKSGWFNKDSVLTSIKEVNICTPKKELLEKFN